MPREKRKSVVWEFYSKTGDNKVNCKLCSCSYKHFGNTTNLINHLKRKHPIQYLEGSDELPVSPGLSNNANTMQCGLEQATVAVGTTNLQVRDEINSNKGHENITVQQNKEPPRKRQRQMRLNVSAPVNQKSVDEALLDMIVLDFQPLQIVENEGFKRYTNALNPDYTLPSRKILSNGMLDNRYNICVAALKEKLQLIDDVALTTDIWTSDNNKSYITLTTHFIQNSKLNSFILSTSELPVEHTSLNIADAIKTILEEWKIYDKIVSIVTDNAKNVTKAVSDYLCKRNHHCVAHTLNLAVKDCTMKDKGTQENNRFKNDELIEVISKCRAIVTHFKHSSKSLYKLKEIQSQMGLEELNFKQDVPTRWNSTLIMIERLVKLKVPLSATLPLLQSPPSNLDSSEWNILEDCISILKPLEKITVILSGESYPTLSSVIPLIRGLQSAIKNKSPSTETGRHLQRSLLEVVDKRLSVYERDRTAATATFLDPRYKKKAFGTNFNADNAQKWVIEELSENELLFRNSYPSESNPAPSILGEPYTDDESLNEIWEQLDKKISETNNEQTPESSATIIVKQYVELPYLNRNQNPLGFWEERKNIFPGLYKMSCKYLCIPATSVPSERLFSKAGMLTNQQRNRLLPKKVNQILFLNSWCNAAYKK